MATKPELNKAIAYEKIKANKWNENFNAILDYIEEVSEELTLKLNTVNSQLSSSILSNLQSVYPVGSLYIGITDTCPIASLFGTWEKISDGFVTGVNSKVPIKGTGATLGLNNNGSATAGYLKLYRSSYNEAVLSAEGGVRGNVYVTTNANSSGIVGTVSTTKLEVNIWKRTA
jgi:hypothetical protein